MVFPVFPVPRLTSPFVPESSDREVPAPVVIDPLPTNPNELAVVLMVSSEITPSNAPAVETVK